MLTLKRKWQERLFLDTADGRITVQVVGTERGYCRLGIEAPQTVKITREELETRDQPRPASANERARTPAGDGHNGTSPTEAQPAYGRRRQRAVGD